MAIRDTLQSGDPRLKAKNKKITRFNDSKVKKVIKDLIETMHQNQLVGMAAQQIGENLKLFVTEPRRTVSRPADQTDILRVYINPVITWFSPEQVTIFEGCGSVAYGTLFAPVTRPKTIKIEYWDQSGQPHWLKCDGILSRVIQHEYDHLHGVEFTEKIDDYKLLMSKEWYLEYSQNHPELIEDTRITIKQSDKVE